MKIIWVSSKLPTGEFNTNLKSTLASARYRVLQPSLYLSEDGVDSFILNPEDFSKRQETIPEHVDAIIFTKLMSPDVAAYKEYADMNLTIADSAKEKGWRIVVDVCDNHFDHVDYGPYQSKIVSLSDVVIANTERMAEIVSRYTGKSAFVIEDPVEGVRKLPRFQPKVSKLSGWRYLLKSVRKNDGFQEDKLRLLWFGHNSNLDTISKFIPQLGALSREIPLHIEIVTAANCGAVTLCEISNAEYGPNLFCEFREWSLEQVVNSLANCDIVILPSDIESEKKQVKSSNRIAESLWAGRYVVANPIPSYGVFQDLAWISEDLCTGIRWALKHPSMVLDQIKNAQDFIAKNFSRDSIGEKWLSILSSTYKAPVAPPEDKPIRLNLGCGDKIIPGYVNVDVAETRGGKKPDIICDLRKLEAFFDNSVDEILSVHVIEHFWRWEVKDILQEWIRVLKPGGELIIECPNLISACEELLKDPSVGMGEGVDGQRSMWVLYGDPRWKDPLMVHRWGYTPESLAAMLSQVGLVNVKQEPAQYKLREPRDMRIVGYKPTFFQNAFPED